MSVSLVENKWIGQLASLVEKNFHKHHKNNWKRATTAQFHAAEQHFPTSSTQNLSKWKSLRRSSVPAPVAWLELQLRNVASPTFDPLSAFVPNEYDETTSISNSEANSELSDDIVSDSSEPIPFAHVNHRYLNDFEQETCLGRGGFGVVLRARNKIDQTEYAIKRVELEDDSVLEALSEVRVMAALPPHAHIIRYYCSWLESAPLSDDRTSSGDEEGALSDMSSCGASESSNEFRDVLYIQMCLCGDGTTLAQVLERRDKQKTGVLNTEDENVFKQILSAVEHMHSNGFEHLDLCPRNVFCDDTGDHWCVGDFSFSKRMGLSGEEDPMGTHLYAAPEVSKKNSNIFLCGAADIFSLGILLAEMCLSFDTAMERVVTLEKLRSSGLVPPPIQTKSPKLSQLITSMVAQNPIDRPSISSVISELDQGKGIDTLLTEMALVRDHFSNAMKGCASRGDYEEGNQIQGQLKQELDLWTSMLVKCSDSIADSKLCKST